MAETVACPSCGSPNETGRKFCGECGRPSHGRAAHARDGESARRQVLRRCGSPLAAATTTSAGAATAARPRCRAPPRLGALCRPRRLHDAAREPGLRGGARASLALLRHEPPPRSSSTAGRSRSSSGDAVTVWGTPTATEDDAERAVRAALGLVAAVSALSGEIERRSCMRARACSPARPPRDHRRRGQGDGRGRAGQLRRADPVGGEAELRVRRRLDAEASELTVVYEDAGKHELKGKEESAQLYRGPASRVRPPRRAEIRRPRAACRTRSRAPAGQELFHALGGRAHRPHRHRHGRRRDRGEVAARLGVLQVLRRARRHRLLASRAVPGVRRRGDVLGARRHGAHALPDRRGRRQRERALQARGRARRAHPRRGRAGLRRAHAREPARDRGGAGLARAPRPLRRLGASSSSGSRAPIRPCSCSRTCSGPMRACSTSSSTCSSGRGRARASSSSSRGPSCWRSARAGVRAAATSRRSISTRSPSPR